MKKITQKQVIENFPGSPKLVRAVIKQLGGWESFRESAPDIANHGISGGYGGMIYYTETVAFAEKHKTDILELTRYWADQGGDKSAYNLIAGFNCLHRSGITPAQVDRLVHIDKRANLADDDEGGRTQIFNALAWFAGEEVAQVYNDLLEE